MASSSDKIAKNGGRSSLALVLGLGLCACLGTAAISTFTGERIENRDASPSLLKGVRRRLQENPMADFVSNLPDYTLISLENPSSPQSQAYTWLSGHPHIDTMATARMTQLFAMATIHYSLDGPNWSRSAWWGPGNFSNWLNYSHPECFWDPEWTHACDQNGTLVNLNLDNIQSNATSGSLAMPPEIGLLSNLHMASYRVEMDVTIENLLPTQHFSLPNLHTLALSSVGGTLSPRIGQLSNLRSLAIYHSQDEGGTYGSLPTELGLLAGMNEINFVDTGFTGPIPTQLGQLSNLGRLGITNTNLAGSVPTEFGLLTTLRSLVMFNNVGINGALPSELGLIARLSDVSIEGNSVSGAIPSELLSLSDVSIMDLSRNQFSSSIPSEIGLAVDLRRVNLRGNQLTGQVPSEMALLTRLYDADLASNRLNGGLPTEIGLCSSLDFFNVSHNDITAPLPSELGLLSSIESFDASHNAIAGELPSEIGQMGPSSGRRMWELDLSFNEINGALPTEVGLMARMRSLKLSNNNIGAPMPSQIGMLAYLQELHLSFNTFDSTIPTEIGLMESVKYLDMSSSSLLGGIPSEMALMTSVVDVDLSNNPSLSGEIPEELSDLVLMHDLHNMDVSGNPFLSGEVPSGLCELNPDVNVNQTYCVLRSSCSFTFDCGQLCGCDSCVCNSVSVGRAGDAEPEVFDP